MDNRTLGEVNYLAVGFVIVQLIFCAICASSISTLMAEEKVNVDDYVDKFSIDIKNIDALQDGLTDAQVGTIQRSFLNVVQRNAFQINLGSNDAEVREGSVVRRYFKNQDLNYISAILDIPSLRQSYWLFYEYSKNPKNQFLSPNDSAVILCINNQKDIIYEGFECNNMYNPKTYNAIVAKYIKFFDFSDFLASVDETTYDAINIYAVSNDVSDGDKERYKEIVKSAIESLGISPDIFRYNLF
ncbi:hypothetical protein IJH15_00630 [Candidatus Saccharibacteria bacterium]|nr:hypothetical protein [Candidatus Saccharibacteria bacterium]MBQ6313402.1 hypothetical protein [Candidatus Saccharibacteria bacterium]